jgi:TatA/E family protein of Tat protein translocase
MLSVPHLIIIFVVALVVFGPEKLPELARNLGKVMAEFRRATGDLRMTFEEHMRDLERETEERRIGGPPPMVPAQGTVATAGPQESADGTPAAALPSANPESSEPAVSSAPSTIYDQPHEPDSHPEIASDAGNRPA